MRYFLLAVAVLLFSCKKNGDDVTVKYEVQGSSTNGYYIAYTNEAGSISYTTGNPGWTYTVNGKNGGFYTLRIIPHSNCSTSGTVNIFFDSRLKATQTVGTFTGSVQNQSGGMSCGLEVKACN